MDIEFAAKQDMTLLDALRAQLPDSSSNRLREMLTQGRVSVDQAVSHRAKQEIAKGTKITIRPRDEAAGRLHLKSKSRQRSRLRILHEDECILVVDKPPNLLSVATDKLEPDTLHSRALEYLQGSDPQAWPFIVHRLDKKTSGVMVFAKDEQSKQRIQQQFAARSVERIYHCLVEGRLTAQNGVVHNHLVEDKNLRVHSCEPELKGAKEAFTEWSVEKQQEPYSLIRVRIGTGRRHQIRVHMSELGLPIAGDRMHKARSDPLKRLCLHASSLGFEHPASGERVTFECNINAFSRLLKHF